MIICLDTSTPECKLTLVHSGQKTNYAWQADRNLAQGVLEFLQTKLVDNDSSLQALDAIVVMKGPGSFTGLRIGMTVCNTIANDRQIPIIGASGSDWIQIGLDRFNNGENDKIVLPDYGGDANITAPRK